MNTVTEPSNLLDARSRAPVVWLVVSSFRNDREIETILEEVHAVAASFFERILIVDSLGTGKIPEFIARRGWQEVIYHSYDRNLGSAGNLAERLRLAAEGGADFAYALNHDGKLQPGVVECLLRHAVSVPRIGAVYPLAYMSSAGGYNITGMRQLPLPAKLTRQKPERDLIDVYWSSSNGALYALEPVRSGLLPMAELWMGWEDLEYGWRLADHGYRQVIACDASFADSYEYVSKSTPMGSYHIVRKPPWTTYYMIRNLVLITRRTRPSLMFAAIVAMRVVLEALMICFIRPDKRARFRCWARGIIDGLQNRAGKWVLPRDPATGAGS